MLKAIDIIVASMTGTALIVADEIVETCKEKNISALITEMDNITYEFLLEKNNPILIVSSTYGQGDVPDGSKIFYNGLKEHSPSLKHINYAVFGLGDMTYKDTFAFGGKKFEDLFDKLEAKQITKSYFHDASDGSLPEEEAVKWFNEKLVNVL